MTMHLSKRIILFNHSLLPKTSFTPRDVAYLSIAHLAIRLGHPSLPLLSRPAICHASPGEHHPHSVTRLQSMSLHQICFMSGTTRVNGSWALDCSLAVFEDM
ncbi:hypothetical protein CBOM_07491 [Ceraceosorus bombacis]|uniref:Uncharacterized protein n=1 Tax=Ceraceosorus bombacis TaxID=401625 RepID=A0A0P1BET9_9BASI|nr:hypothetical protein CBOM_07491 [Ceraceosorus bombacis]